MSPQTPTTTPGRPDGPRILMYSHDSYGLGHFCRTVTIGRAFSRFFPGASILVATGSPCSSHFELPERVEVLKLPSVTKEVGGQYVSRSLPCSLGQVVELRSRILLETFRAFRPHLMVVDHQVVGLKGELRAVLAEAESTNTQTILGMRDIVDSPEVVAQEWGRREVRRALSESYDRVCVYGSPAVFDPRLEYPMPPEIGKRVEFVGYVVREAPAIKVRPLPPERPQVLVTMGGGEDAASRLETYLDCLALKPVDWDTTLVLGPLLQADRATSIRRRARVLGNISTYSFLEDLPAKLAASDAVVGMAGYNTTAEILQSGVPAVLLPRTSPRREQELRAGRLARLGLAQSLPHPTAETLRGALETALTRRPARTASLKLDGAARMCAIARELLEAVHGRTHGALVA